MSDQNQKTRRRNVFSNPKVQIRIILVFVAIALLFAGTNWYVSLTSLKAAASQVRDLELTAIQEADVNVIFRQQRVTLELQLMVLTFASFVLLVMAGVLMSHHIGGPMYQLGKYLKDVVDGNAEPREVGFRRHDFFADVAERFNAFQRKFGIVKEETPAGRE
jgi:hypothetical protein